MATILEILDKSGQTVEGLSLGYSSYVNKDGVKKSSLHILNGLEVIKLGCPDGHDLSLYPRGSQISVKVQLLTMKSGQSFMVLAQ